MIQPSQNPPVTDRTSRRRSVRLEGRRRLLFESLESRNLLAAAALRWDAIFERPPNGSDPAFPNSWPAESSPMRTEGFEFPDTQRWMSTVTNGSGLQQGDPTTLTWSVV